MPTQDARALDAKLAAVAARHGALRLLVLFGSRARGDARPDSDWDLGFVAAAGFDALSLRAELVDVLPADRFDLVDLARAGALLRYRAARDGRALYERAPGLFARFQYEAASFWCDAGPLIRRHYDALLAGARR